MAATGGVPAPLLPKRPTVIRPGATSGPAVPNRPAPPVPARKGDENDTGRDADPPRQQPPPPPARPTSQIVPPPTPARPTSQGPPPLSARPTSQGPPPLSARPTSQGPPPLSARPTLQGPPPPPARPTDKTRQTSVINSTQQNTNNSSATSTTGKRRPEITIVSARPMSEIGFRNINASDGSKPEDTNTGNTILSKADTQPDVPIVQLAPRSEETAISTVGRVPPPRPTVIRPNVPPVHDKPKTDDTRGELKQSIRTQPPVPRLPPSPRQRTADDTDHLEKSTTVPNGIPVPVPRGASVKLEQHESASNVVVDNLVDLSAEDKNSNVTEDMYSVINKPKRPTIIRPNRPVGKGEEPKQNDKTPEDTAGIKPVVPVKVIPSPTMTRRDNQENSGSNILSARKSFFESKQEGEAVPEFLTKRLKSTVPIENDAMDKFPSTQALNKPPPPPAKPKPTIIPKPQIAAKPSVAAKPTIPHKNNIVKNVEESSNDTKIIEIQTPTDNPSPETVVNKPGVVKRPTIIRPSRVVQSGSSENVDNVEQSDTKTDSVRLRSSDDNLNRHQSRPQPPLPTKRPVSMISIPDALAKEEKASNHPSRSNHLISSSTENINKMLSSPKPIPRPMARPRPASMMVPASNERPPLPSAGPIVQSNDEETGSPPLRPQQRPSVTGTKDDSPPGNTSRMSALGVPVLPRLDKNESHDIEPSKPVVRRPPPPKAKPEMEPKESSSEEEFFTAQTKPDRPAGLPLPKAHTQSQTMPTETSVEKKAPPRPGGGPSPLRKTSMDVDKDEISKVVRNKPERPDSKPPRPGSVPVKTEQPGRPQPPRPGAGPPKKRQSNHGLPPRPGPDHALYRYMMQAPHGIALYDYTARQDDELEFKQGDVIILVKYIDADWIVGQVGDREGMFPKGFIKVQIPFPGQDLSDDDSSDDPEQMFYDASTEKPDLIGTGPRCRARFDFDGEGVGDLPFEEGDVIRLLERVGTEWRKGEYNGRVGVFPIVYIDVIEDLPEDNQTHAKSTKVTAMFDFDGQAGDLTFQAGEIIDVKYAISEEWLYGVIGERTGQFPVQFIDHIPAELPSMPTTEKQEEKPTNALTAAMSMWDTVDDNNSQPTMPVEENNRESAPDKPIRSVQEETPYCLALYEYPGETDDDLKFSTGDRIDLIERVNADWYKGCCHGITGIFPSAFVEIKVDLPGTTSEFQSSESLAVDLSSQQVQTEMGVAQYDFTGETVNELTFKSGDRIELQEYVSGAEDWRYGALNGLRGIFPAAFVISDS